MKKLTRREDLVAVLLEMAEQLYAEIVAGEEALDLHEEVHHLAETFLEAEPVVLGRTASAGGRWRGVRDTVDAVLRVHRVHRRHRRVVLRV